MVAELYPHQQEALKKLKSGAILCGGVGSGKSRTAIGYYYYISCEGSKNQDGTLNRMRKPKDLYIITTARKRDTLEWEDECLSFLLSTKKELNSNDVVVKVDSWNNIHKYSEVKDAFFIFDEQRLVGSGTWVKNFLKISKSNEWILLSATPGDTWMDYIPVFIANGFYRNRTEFIRKHVVYNRFSKFPKVDKYINTGVLEKYRKRIVVNMPYPRHTIRHKIRIFTDFDKESYDTIFTKRWNSEENRPVRDAGEACLMLRKVVNSDPSRCKKVYDIYKEKSKAIVFYQYNYELESLIDLCVDKKIPYSQWNGHKHDPVPDVDSWLYLVQYTAGAEGWNCITTDTVIFYSLNYSYKIMEQSMGRIDRMNTPYVDLYYYYLVSNSTIDYAISKAIDNKKKFNEKLFINF